MTDTPTTDAPVPQSAAQKPAPASEKLFTQANITTGLAVLAVILAGAPYVVPQLQAYQVQSGLMARPVMVEQAKQKLDAQRADAASKAAAIAIKGKMDSLFGDKSDPVLGNPNGTVRMVEFLDYNCGYCRAATPVLKQFLADNPDVKLIVKEYPVISANSRPLAAYALAAAGMGKYEPVHYALMTEHVKSETDMSAVLTAVGLDAEAVKTKAKSKDIQDHIDRVLMLGADLAVDGTPTFVINGQAINGANFDGLKSAVAAERAKLKKS